MSARVLVREDVGESGLSLLREHFDVVTGFDWSPETLAERIGEFDAILVRSATTLTAELIERGERLRVIARAGVGVDNVDVAAATRRGIVVANAPQHETEKLESIAAIAAGMFAVLDPTSSGNKNGTPSAGPATAPSQ